MTLVLADWKGCILQGCGCSKAVQWLTYLLAWKLQSFGWGASQPWRQLAPERDRNKALLQRETGPILLIILLIRTVI